MKAKTGATGTERAGFTPGAVMAARVILAPFPWITEQQIQDAAGVIDEQTAAPEMLEALQFVKEFFRKMEEHDLPGDPLLELRRKFHAPVHAKIDAALLKAQPVAQGGAE